MTETPLQLASLAGLSAAFFGILVLVWVPGGALLQGITVPGFAFLATTIAIFSGVQLFSIGIIGEGPGESVDERSGSVDADLEGAGR